MLDCTPVGPKDELVVSHYWLNQAARLLTHPSVHYSGLYDTNVRELHDAVRGVIQSRRNYSVVKNRIFVFGAIVGFVLGFIVGVIQ